MQLATRATALTEERDAEALDVLASAYAESGRFAVATNLASRAEQRAIASGQKELAERIRERLLFTNPDAVIASRDRGIPHLRLVESNVPCGVRRIAHSFLNRLGPVLYAQGLPHTMKAISQEINCRQ